MSHTPPGAAAWKAPVAEAEGEPPPFDWAREPARLAGIVAHRWLQRIAEDRLEGWDAMRVDGLRPVLERDLRGRGLPSPGASAGLVMAALKNALVDERGRWLLGPHPLALNEHRLRSPGRSFRIDRYIEDAKGGRWVVDYKTGEHKGGSVDAFLDSERDRYRKQLDDYARAKEGARPALYFPLLKGWREW